MSLKILVADDNKFTRHICEDRLQRRNHQVTLVDDGWQCVEAYKTEFEKIGSDTNKTIFDAILLDYSMPVLKGNEVAEEILKVNPNQKIIITSAWDSKILKESFEKIKNKVEIIQKGFPLEALIDKLEDDEAK